jgi:hypothetical protein
VGRLLRRLGLSVAGAALALAVGCGLISERRPEAAPSAEADALARSLAAAVDADAWARTGAVRFVFRGKNAWLWDRAKGRARLRAGDREILFRTHDRTGVAFEDGRPLSGEALDDALAGAWKAFCNDTFWLNPLVKLFDDGTQRALVPTEAGLALLVTYGSGGVTPGDAYLWHVGPDDRPTAWQMWVQILPVGGVRMTWEGWQTLESGAVVSTLHKGAIADLALTEVAGGATLDGLEPGAFDRLGPR